MTVKKSGELQYTARAFKQDSEDAMKGDVIRALIELITNADDAYNSKGGKIQIRFLKAKKPFQAIISVHDQATGLNADGLETAFARLGDLNQKFVGDMGTRGLFGRGAKDVAALGKAQTSATTVQAKAKNINNMTEFPGAFENWISNLGLPPEKVTRGTLESAIRKVLVKLGYK